MKYDNYTIIESESHENDNIIRSKNKKKIGLLDIFIVQAAICVMVSVALMIVRIF